MSSPLPTLPTPPVSTAVVLIRAVVILAVVTVAAIVLTSYLLPDNPALADRIVTYAGGITAGLMLLLRSEKNGAGIQAVHVDLNSRLTAFMQAQAEAEHAKGRLEGVATATTDQQDAVMAATAEAARVARVAAETATAAAQQVARVATEAAAALARLPGVSPP